MNATFLELLRCPFCGGRFTLHNTGGVDADGAGILCCACCAFPVVGEIPYVRTGSAAEAAMRLLGEGKPDRALIQLLGLSDEPGERFQRLLQREQPATFREFLTLLCPGAEGDYLYYRFSDPTFVCCQAVVRALAQDRPSLTRRVLDVCGGAGHLTRSLGEYSTEVVLADLSFAKLWLARRFVAPSCQPVCCDAGEPLPFAAGTFSLVHCSDAFHYIWRRRSLANEMMRLVDDRGTIVLTHLHNLLAENVSAGMPLAPAGYRDLFAGLATRIFKETDVFEALLARQKLDFSINLHDDELRDEAALVLLSARGPEFFQTFAFAADEIGERRLSRNPFYVVDLEDDGEVWTLHFPSPGYELEFANCRRYLPDSVRLTRQDLDDIRERRPNEKLSELAQRRVLLDLPDGYDRW